MDDQTASLLSSLQGIPHTSDGLNHLLEVAGAARMALSSDPDGLHALVERLVSWTVGSEDGSEAAHVLIESARILIEEAGDWEHGVDLYERALKRAPTEIAALHRVERLLSVREAWERLEVVLLTHANALDYDAMFEVEERGEAWRRLGQLRASRLCDLDGAIVAYDTALEVHPEPRWMLELAELYDRRNQVDDPAAAAQLYYRAADIIDGPAVIPYLEQALDRDPLHEAALDMLEALTAPEYLSLRLEPRWRAFAADAPAGDKRTSMVQRLANHYAHGVASPKAVEKLSQTLSPPPPTNWASKVWLGFRKPKAAARSQTPVRSGRTLPVGGMSVDRGRGVPKPAKMPRLPAATTLRGVPEFDLPIQPRLILGHGLVEARSPLAERSATGWYPVAAAACAFAIIVLWTAPQVRVIATAVSAALPSERAPAPPPLPVMPTIPPHAVDVPAIPPDAVEAPPIPPHAVSESPARVDPDAGAPLAIGASEPIPGAPTPAEKPEASEHALVPRFTVMSGSMPEPELTAVLAEVQRKLEQCAADALASEAEPRGSMVLTWLIRAYGRATKVRYRRGSVHDGEARLCAQGVLRDTRFPRPATESASVEATFELGSDHPT